MVQANFKHFAIGTRLYACFGSQIRTYIVTGVNIEYSVDINEKTHIQLMYDLQNIRRTTDSPRILDSDMNKVYFSSEQELLKHIVAQMS